MQNACAKQVKRKKRKKSSKGKRAQKLFASSDSNSEEEIPVENKQPREICKDPSLISTHIDYWLNHMPDMSDAPVIRHADLKFWSRQQRSKKKDTTKAHRFLKGLKASWVNASVDFVLSLNKWPVIFVDSDGDTVDLTVEVILVFWVSYLRYMASPLNIFMSLAAHARRL